MGFSLKTRAIRGPVVLLTGFALIGGMAASAAAAPGDALPGQDGEATAVLNIHKHHTPRAAVGDGKIETVATPGIGGVKFEVCKVDGIDLTTRAGWEAARAFLKTDVADDNIDDFDVQNLLALPKTNPGNGDPWLNPCHTFTTNAAGLISEELDLGLYVVTETDRSGAYIDANANGRLDLGEDVNGNRILDAGEDTNGNLVLDGSELVSPLAVDPFAVTLPLTDPDTRDAWMYDVHVYPKNDTVDITKTVNDANAPNGAVVLGDNVVYTITADVPAPGNLNESLTGFVITDVLDPKLDFISASVAGVGVNLTLGTDYTISAPAVSATGTVTVEFERAGLDKLWDAANADQNVKVVLTLTTAATASGEIPNKASLNVNAGEVTIETENVFTKFGSIDLLKNSVDAALLEGAVFELYANEADALAQTNPIGVDTNGDQVADKFTWETGADGKVSVNGLRYEGWENNGIDSTPITYWLVERVAPDGYELLADPVEVTGVWGDQVETDPDFTIVNVKHNAGFALPKVGGAGIALFSIAGLGAAGLFMVLARRRETEEA